MYNIQIHLIVVCADLNTGKKYILSSKKDEILPLTMTLNKDNINHLEEKMSEYIRNIVPIHTLSVRPQIISLNSKHIVSSYKRANENLLEDAIHPVYGILAEYIPLIDDNFHWVEFHYEIENNFSLAIFEVCQSLV